MSANILRVDWRGGDPSLNPMGFSGTEEQLRQIWTEAMCSYLGDADGGVVGRFAAEALSLVDARIRDSAEDGRIEHPDGNVPSISLGAIIMRVRQDMWAAWGDPELDSGDGLSEECNQGLDMARAHLARGYLRVLGVEVPDLSRHVAGPDDIAEYLVP